MASKEAKFGLVWPGLAKFGLTLIFMLETSNSRQRYVFMHLAKFGLRKAKYLKSDFKVVMDIPKRTSDANLWSPA